jgi:NTP pyrophosphatase (non-canonical NTP hydrolase)
MVESDLNNIGIIEALIFDLQNEVHRTAVEHGWWEDMDRNVPEQICLFHSELSEALEEFRNGRDVAEIYYSYPDAAIAQKPPKPEGFPVELADCIIRILDTCGQYNIPLGRAIVEKMRYNESRPYRHGNKVV